MGVSGLLRDVLKRYPTIHLPAPHPDIKVDYLFLDFNAFIYNTIHAFPKNVFYDFTKNTNTTKYEDKLVELVIQNTLDLVNKIVKPSKLLYIAVDGPPPLAKMVQQRERRYKKPLIESILKENKTVIEGTSYDTNRITPGTRLMDLLNREFESAIKKGKFEKVAVVYDGSDIPGEAEHKYLKLIEEISPLEKDNFVIFSGDGDAILLSLRYPDRNMYIMQGIVNTALEELYPPEQQFAFLDSKKLGDAIYNLFEMNQAGGKKVLTNAETELLKTLQKADLPKKEVKNELKNFEREQKRNFLIDFIFLSFIEGNDFAKPFYFLKYKDDHMRTPLGIYKFNRRIHNNNPNYRLINYKEGQLYINQPFFTAIIKRLGNIEEQKIQDMKRRYEKKMSQPPIKKENNALEHKMFTNQDHKMHSEFVKQYEFLFDYKDFKDFKKRYYEYFWDNEYDIDTICKNYLNILLFNIRYYFGTGLYWELNYDAVAAPLPSDLANFMERNPQYLDTVDLKEGEPVHPFVLLAYVMPPQSMKPGIIPKSYKDALLKKYPEYFPEKIELKLLTAGGKLIYAEPHFKAPPLQLLKDVLKEVKISKNEMSRNELKKEPIVYIPK